MGQNVTAFGRRNSVQLAAVLFVGGLLALLFSSEGGTAASSKIRGIAERNPMVELASVDLNGRTWKLADHRGEVVLLNVWASWCPPCRAETPGLVNLANKYRGRGFEIVGMSMDDSPQPVRRFVDEFHVPYTVVMPSADSPLASAVESLPTSFLLDRKGRVAKIYTGAVSEQQLRGDLDRLLAEPS